MSDNRAEAESKGPQTWIRLRMAANENLFCFTYCVPGMDILEVLKI